MYPYHGSTNNFFWSHNGLTALQRHIWAFFTAILSGLRIDDIGENRYLYTMAFYLELLYRLIRHYYFSRIIVIIFKTM